MVPSHKFFCGLDLTRPASNIIRSCLKLPPLSHHDPIFLDPSPPQASPECIYQTSFLVSFMVRQTDHIEHTILRQYSKGQQCHPSSLSLSISYALQEASTWDRKEAQAAWGWMKAVTIGFWTKLLEVRL